MVVGSQAGVEIRTWPDLVVTETIATSLINVHDIRFSPDGKGLLIAGGSPSELGAVELVNWPTTSNIRPVAIGKDVVYRIAWSPDGKYWATASADAHCRVFTSDSAREVASFGGHSRAVQSLAFLPLDNSIASVSVDQTVQLWNASTGRHIRTLNNHVAAVNDVAIQPTSPQTATPIMATVSEDRTVRLWQPTSGRMVRFARLASVPRTVAWNTTGDLLYVGSNDGSVRVLTFDTLEVTQTLAGLNGRVHELLVDTTGSRLLVAGESGIRVINLK